MKIPRQILRRGPRPDGVAATVAQQSTEAADLARIPGQHRLTDPRTNPAVRTHADRLRNAQHRRALDAEHGRVLRRHRVADRRAAHAEQALNALQQAREASSAAKSVLALHAGRTRFMGVALAASLSLSYGAATGVAEYAERNDAPWQAGYLAEVGFTGLSTAVILYRSHLVRHGGQISGWRDKVLWLLMVVPLAASMAANLAGAGPVGVACSVGAAAFSLLSYVIADLSAVAIQDRAARVTGDDEDDLRLIASGDDLFAASETDVGSADAGLQTWFEVQGLSFTPAWFKPTQVHAEVHSQVRSKVHQEVRGPEALTESAPRELEPPIANQTPRTTIGEPSPEPVNQPNPEPAEPEVREPKRRPQPQVQREAQKTANLTDRAAKKHAEVQQVLNLIKVHGYDAVTLGVVQKELGFAKTTASYRLKAARELANREPASQPAGEPVNHEAVNR